MPSPEILLAGETVVPRGDGSLYWPGEATLFVADVHLGKAASFRALSVPVPAGTTAGTLGRLAQAVEATGAQRVIFLGDLWHSKQGQTDSVLGEFLRWREALPSVAITLVPGNHDRKARMLMPDCECEIVRDGTALGPFILAHEPSESEQGYTLAGHIHPAVRLTGRGDQDMRLPCFWFSPTVGVLPAFGDFTGKATVLPKAGDRVFVTADGAVYAVPVEAKCSRKAEAAAAD